MSRAHDMDCDRVRKQAHRYRRGELILAETSTIERHLEGCATCRDYYERLDILLDAASNWQPAKEETTSADDLFAGIAARIEQPEEPAALEPQHVEEAFDADDDAIHYDYDFGSRRWVSAVIGLAAGVLLTLAGFYVYKQLEGSGTNPVEVVAEQDNTSLDSLAHQESTSSQVEVFASKDADWRLVGDEDLVLELTSGSVLVEFVPQGGRTLRVDTPQMSVQVVGTVFFVSADDDGPRAGVLAGEVEVLAKDGKTATLGPEREIGADFQPREMPAARKASLSRHVDTEAHLEKLAELERTEAKPAKRTKQPARRSVVRKAAQPDGADEKTLRLPPDLERLRARAEKATRRKNYHDAVRYYRNLLDRLPPVHPIAASVHLDLAHIYLHRLNSPGRAAPHLRIFLERWPSDVAAESARRELCKIDESEPGCEVAK